MAETFMMEGRETGIIVAPSRGSLPGDGTASFQTVFVRACSPRRISRAEKGRVTRSALHPGFVGCPRSGEFEMEEYRLAA